MMRAITKTVPASYAVPKVGGNSITKMRNDESHHKNSASTKLCCTKNGGNSITKIRDDESYHINSASKFC